MQRGNTKKGKDVFFVERRGEKKNRSEGWITQKEKKKERKYETE